MQKKSIDLYDENRESSRKRYQIPDLKVEQVKTLRTNSKTPRPQMAASKNLQEMRKQFKENKHKTVEEVKEPSQLEAKLNDFANDFQEKVRADRSPSLNKKRFTNILAQKQKSPAKDSPKGADMSDLFALPKSHSEIVPEQILPLE